LNEKNVCDKCISKLIFAPPDLINHEFDRKFKSENIIKEFLSLYIFKPDSEIQNIIHSFKYNKQYQIGIVLGEQISEHLHHQINKWNADFIIPIPLHRLRKAERGFNQSEKIAISIKHSLNISVYTDIIRRCRFTKTQTKLTLEERKENMSDAFTLRKHNLIKNKNIILLDDIITTGATITECGKLLKGNGANNIYALSVAIAE